MSAISIGPLASAGSRPSRSVSPTSPGSSSFSLPSHSASKSTLVFTSRGGGGGGGGGGGDEPASAPPLAPVFFTVDANARDQTTCSAHATASSPTLPARAPPPPRTRSCNERICSRCS